MYTAGIVIEVPELDSPFLSSALDTLGGIGITLNDVLSDLLLGIMSGEYRTVDDLINHNGLEAYITNIFENESQGYGYDNYTPHIFNSPEILKIQHEWVVNGISFIESCDAMDFVVMQIAPSVMSIVPQLPLVSNQAVVHQVSVEGRQGNALFALLHIGANKNMQGLGQAPYTGTVAFQQWVDAVAGSDNVDPMYALNKLPKINSEPTNASAITIEYSEPK